eukprot:TRINITY_DN3499_c0_g1_i11.p1 TRINITY_DN3499_c0_g1~~TRINITY_DN3499_c0_g1_i11.p1  ORF type:complete len:116 (-),score=18.74 TRINITY_DN3499_c0_g1_i11:162-509(-)
MLSRSFRTKVATVDLFRPRLSVPLRLYSDAERPTTDEIRARVIDVVMGFDKVTDPSKVTATSHLSRDLGIESLDKVELTMALEEEFVIEIPDPIAEQVQTIEDIVQYLSTNEHVM